MIFRQCIFSQFNRKLTQTLIPTKDKQASISRILPLIPLRPNKSILAKSKFFKKNQISNLNSKL